MVIATILFFVNIELGKREVGYEDDVEFKIKIIAWAFLMILCVIPILNIIVIFNMVDKLLYYIKKGE